MKKISLLSTVAPLLAAAQNAENAIDTQSLKCVSRDRIGVPNVG